MSRHDAALTLRQMLDHAREALDMVEARSRVDLDQDRTFSLALTRLLEIVGEAAARVPPETRAALPSIPWPQIVGLRNRLIHAYDQVDHDILWQVGTRDLPVLISQLRTFLASHG